MKNEGLFFIAIIPPEDLQNEITQFKLEIAERFGSRHALNAPPHITLHMPFRWRADKVDRLTKAVAEISASIEPFEVGLSGFDFFEPRVVFISVEENETLNNLQKQVVDLCRKELKLDNANYRNQPFHPHITIGFRDLKKAMFYEVKEHYKGKIFNAHFFVKEVHLLKHDAKSWQLVN